jgi:hypothetical protein
MCHVGNDHSDYMLGREWPRSREHMVGRESSGSLVFIRILALVKSGQKSAGSTMPSIFTPYRSLFTLYNNKTFCYSSTVKWSIYIYLSSKRYESNLTLSIILSPSHTLTDLGVGGGTTGQPPAGLCFVAGYRQRGESEAAMSSGWTSSSTVWRRLWEQFNRSLEKENYKMVTGGQWHPSSRGRVEQVPAHT